MQFMNFSQVTFQKSDKIRLWMIVLLHRDVKLADFSYWNYDISQYNATMLKARLKKLWWTKRKKISLTIALGVGIKKMFDCIFKYHLFTFLHWKFNVTNFCTSQLIRVPECKLNKLKGHMKKARCERYCSPTFCNRSCHISIISPHLQTHLAVRNMS